MKLVFCSKLQSESMIAAYNTIVHVIKYLNYSSQDLNEVEELSPER